MRQCFNKYSDMRQGYFLKSTGDMALNKRQRHATLAFNKIDRRHGDPPSRAPQLVVLHRKAKVRPYILFALFFFLPWQPYIEPYIEPYVLKVTWLANSPVNFCLHVYVCIAAMSSGGGHEVGSPRGGSGRSPYCRTLHEGARAVSATLNRAQLCGKYVCRVSGVPPGRECSENFGGSSILAVRPSLTGNRGEYLRVVEIHSDG